MKKILIAAAALATLTGAAGAASAQQYYGPGYGYDRDGRGGYDNRYERRADLPRSEPTPVDASPACRQWRPHRPDHAPRG